MKADQINSLALAVFCDPEKIDDTEKAGGAGERGRDVGQADGLDRSHFDRAFFHAVTVADLNVRTRPDAHAAGNFAGTYALAKTFSEYHVKSFTIRAA